MEVSERIENKNKTKKTKTLYKLNSSKYKKNYLKSVEREDPSLAKIINN